MASKRRNVFYENKKQETTEIDLGSIHIDFQLGTGCDDVCQDAEGAGQEGGDGWRERTSRQGNRSQPGTPRQFPVFAFEQFPSVKFMRMFVRIQKEQCKKTGVVLRRLSVHRGSDTNPDPEHRRDATRKPEGVAEDLVAGPEVFYDTPCYYREYNWKTKKSKPLKLPPEPSYPFQPSVIERGIKVVPLADPCTDILEPTKDRGALHR
ncbi:hypothetical protein AAG570_002662 [Ranatra chinensis]|uniref:Uncharacterized protein n=1 Tax=Ranatra chinensis TaxID=642074 RepID=A0ABD0Y882_9HEMI